MKRKLLYIVNPISGVQDKVSVQELINIKTKEANLDYLIFPSVLSGDYSYLHPVIKEHKITDVVIAGGDGTINHVIQSLKKFPVQFGIIPCGSGNGLAFSAGIPKNTEKALSIIFEGKSQWTDSFLINDTFACMLCGLGFDAQVAHDFANDPKRGLTTYIKQTLKNFITSSSYPFVLTTHGRTIKTQAFFISIANSNQFGNHFTIAPKASLSDGLLDIVIMTRQNKIAMLLQALRQVAGYNKLQKVEMLNEESSVIYFQTDNLSIFNPQEAPMHIDGDPVETCERINFKVLKSDFRLIAPPRSA